MNKTNNTEKSIPEGPALYIIATPIGNLEDIILRALRILKQTDRILSEDTRKTSILLREYGIQTPLKSFRVHRMKEDIESTLEFLKTGENIAFVSEAGTPGISDPGSHLVREVRERFPDIPILPIPGPSAIASALSISGFQTNPTLYLGFLSPKKSRRKSSLNECTIFPGVIVLYESVHRIEGCMADIREIFPDRQILVAREMTKIYEEYILLDTKNQKFEGDRGLKKKGEFTVIIGPKR